MIRTQIQLTENQAARLKRLAARRGVSVAKLIRDSVDQLLNTPAMQDPDDERTRALALIGCGASGLGDLSTKHDDYLADEPGD